MPRNDSPDQSYTTRWSDGRGAVKFFTRSDGSRLRYFTAGTGAPLVLLHTVRTQLDYFQRVIPQVWDTFTIYALDLPGMGWSDIVPGAHYEEPELRQAVVEFVTGLDLRDVTLAGESIDAALALSASIGLNDRLRRVVAVNPYDYPGGLERGNWFARLVGISIRTPAFGRVFAAMENRPILKGVLRGGFTEPHHLPKDFLAELRRSGRRKGYPTVSSAMIRSLTSLIQARHRYADIATPVSLVYSQNDWSRVAEREYVARFLGGIKWTTVPDTGHFSALERPDNMASMLLQVAGRIVG
jgi:pimeloyl-ACP methyl ester carboxylesterase